VIRRTPRLHYRHQVGVCTAGSCPGHTVRAGRRGFAHMDSLRRAGRLAYLGPGPRPAWLSRLIRRPTN
jgi:hypothetical protein